jgi:hypothetical protein
MNTSDAYNPLTSLNPLSSNTSHPSDTIQEPSLCESGPFITHTNQTKQLASTKRPNYSHVPPQPTLPHKTTRSFLPLDTRPLKPSAHPQTGSTPSIPSTNTSPTRGSLDLEDKVLFGPVSNVSKGKRTTNPPIWKKDYHQY